MISRLATFALALACLGCMANQPVATVPTPAAAASAPLTAAMAGTVSLPLLALGTNGIIPTGIGAVISAGGAKLRTLQATVQAFEERPVAGAVVIALDATTLAPLPGVAPAQTDAQGHYALAVPMGAANVVVEALFRSPDGTRGFRLLTAAHPAEAADVSWASTVAVAALLDASGHPRPELAAADVRELAIAATNQAADLAPAAAATFFAAELAVPVEAIPAQPTGLVGSPPPVPAGLPIPLNPSPNAVASAVANVVASTVPTVVGSTIPAVLTSTLPNVLTSTVPGVVGALLPSAGASANPVEATTTQAAQTVSNATQAVTETTQAVANPTTQAVDTTAQTVTSTTQTVTETAGSTVQALASSLPLLHH